MRYVQTNAQVTAHVSVAPTEEKQRDYALNRLADVRGEKHDDLRKQFHLVDDDQPSTFNEFMARLTAGKFTFPEERKDKKYDVWSIVDLIRWRDPAVKEDQDGYDAAYEALQKAYQEVRDQVVLSDAAGVRSALDSFKSWTYTASVQ